MQLTWSEIRVRAADFARKWAEATHEKSETHSFYDEFFDIFGISRQSVARYEQKVKLLNNRRGYIDLFVPGKLIVEQKSAGRDLRQAYEQASKYFDGLSEEKRPRYILISDFRNFELHDLAQREQLSFQLGELHKHIEKFGFILGVQPRTFRDEDPANIKAAELVGRLHDALEGTGYTGHDLERLLVRIVFCLFADDTGIFDPLSIFLEFMERRTRDDGKDLGAVLSQLFEVLNTPVENRLASLDEGLSQFPYINGSLFEGALRFPSFDASMRTMLIDACNFDWSNISPAIFGALFQSVMDPEERRAQGAHYTTEKNILKVIGPLFLDDLRAQFNKIKARKDRGRLSALRHFQKQLAEMRFLDPACGCGNFLIIAYREIRLLEMDAIRQMGEFSFPLVNVDQFHGIELSEFPARIARAALWMMDHIMNNQLSLEFGRSYLRIPLVDAPHIVQGDALELDWKAILVPDDRTVIMGNPPFVGAKLQSGEQRAQVRRIAALGKSGGTLDYVTAWFIKAGEYVQETAARIGFVATNSITQGEQVAQLWPILFGRFNLSIDFAHRTFAWGSDARGKAHVHVVVIGLAPPLARTRPCRLFSYADVRGEAEERQARVLSPYLFDAGSLQNPRLTIREENHPINGLGRLIIGSKPIDGGHYIFSAEQRVAFLEAEPEAAPFMRPFVGAREYLQGGERWIMALHDASPNVLARLPKVRERIATVRAYREASKSVPTRRLADTPTLYHVNVLPTKPFLAIPKTSSERREYVPIGWLEPPTIPSDAVFVLQNTTLANFALLTSALHMAWLRLVGGRLKSDYRYSIGGVYNTFPTPMEGADLLKLEPLAQAVLNARAAHPEATLADLYDPDLMPPHLRRAHRALDRAVDRLYDPAGFKSDHERIRHLFSRYEAMFALPLEFQAYPDPKLNY